MSTFIEKFEAYGANTKDVMDRFMGDEEFLISCLDQFVEENEIERLKECIALKDYDGAFEAAHSLKGVTGNLGITPLFEIVSLLVEDLRMKAYDDVENKLQSVLQKADEFCTAYQGMK